MTFIASNRYCASRVGSASHRAAESAPRMLRDGAWFTPGATPTAAFDQAGRDIFWKVFYPQQRREVPPDGINGIGAHPVSRPLRGERLGDDAGCERGGASRTTASGSAASALLMSSTYESRPVSVPEAPTMVPPNFFERDPHLGAQAEVIVVSQVDERRGGHPVGAHALAEGPPEHPKRREQTERALAGQLGFGRDVGRHVHDPVAARLGRQSAG